MEYAQYKSVGDSLAALLHTVRVLDLSQDGGGSQHITEGREGIVIRTGRGLLRRVYWVGNPVWFLTCKNASCERAVWDALNNFATAACGARNNVWQTRFTSLQPRVMAANIECVARLGLERTENHVLFLTTLATTLRVENRHQCVSWLRELQTGEAPGSERILAIQEMNEVISYLDGLWLGGIDQSDIAGAVQAAGRGVALIEHVETIRAKYRRDETIKYDLLSTAADIKEGSEVVAVYRGCAP